MITGTDRHSHHSIQAGSGAYPTYLIGTGVLSLEVNWLELFTDFPAAIMNEAQNANFVSQQKYGCNHNVTVDIT
jgi:hypothetical protein